MFELANKKLLDLNGLETFWNNVDERKQDSINLITHNNNDNIVAINANEFHQWDVVESLTIELNPVNDVTKYNEYMFQFTSGESPTILSISNNVKWFAEPNIESNKIYQVSIVNNLGIIVGYNL